MMQPEPDHAILYDSAYTDRLNERIGQRFAPKSERVGVHATDLLYCLRKAHGKRRIPKDEQEAISEETILTWGEGLMFEDLISEGAKQKAGAYCFHCRVVSGVGPSVGGEPPSERCCECGNPVLFFTPDYIVGGIIHEAKQTRKSRRHGPEGAPWWVDQLRTYLMFARYAGWTDLLQARLVVNWLMGDYGSKRKGERPRPPQAALDSYLITFASGFERLWEAELLRRMQVVLADEQPVLTGMGRDLGDADGIAPAYNWECGSCPVGMALNCELFRWDAEGKEIDAMPVPPKEVMPAPTAPDASGT